MGPDDNGVDERGGGKGARIWAYLGGLRITAALPYETRHGINEIYD